MNFAAILLCLALFWLGYYLGARAVRNKNVMPRGARIARAGFRTPLIPYTVDYSEYRNKKGRYEPVIPHG